MKGRARGAPPRFSSPGPGLQAAVKGFGVTTCGAVGAQGMVREQVWVWVGQKTPKFRLVSEKRCWCWVLLFKGGGAG